MSEKSLIASSEEEKECEDQQPPPLKKLRRVQPSRSCRDPEKIDWFAVLYGANNDGAESESEEEEEEEPEGRGYIYSMSRSASHKFETLQAEIIEQSQADNWMEAKAEWRLQYIYPEPNGTCLCTHHPITDHCVIKNWKNNKLTTVGNVCIKQFNSSDLTIENSCWDSLRKLRQNPAGSTANASLLNLAHTTQIIWRKEKNSYRTYTTGEGSRNRFNRDSPRFSPVAHRIRKNINKRILYGFHSQRPHCRCGPDCFAKPCCSGLTGTFFYGCWNWHSSQNPGCGFTQAVPPLS